MKEQERVTMEYQDLNSHKTTWLNATEMFVTATSQTALTSAESHRYNWFVLLLWLFVVAGITGNVLVCMAVLTVKKLQNVTNYFLTSLAVADLFVCCVVMPLSIVSEFMGK